MRKKSIKTLNFLKISIILTLLCSKKIIFKFQVMRSKYFVFPLSLNTLYIVKPLKIIQFDWATSFVVFPVTEMPGWEDKKLLV